MVEYYDRLPIEKKRQLEQIIGGGDLAWKSKFARLSKENKLRIGEIVFGEPVENVRVTFEKNYSTGWDIPLIHAEKVYA